MRIFLSLLAAMFIIADPAQAKPLQLLNASFDPTREFYEAYNQQFAARWQEQHGDKISIRQSHGGSGKQARAVIDGLPADVVTLALAYDIDAIAEKSKKIPSDWRDKLPNNSTPATSTIVLLVRKDNPKKIKDWGDLIKPGVEIITPNPKTSGGARWNYLGAWVYALAHFNKDEEQAKTFIQTLYRNVKVLDTGARGSTTTFAQRNMGDVLITWENEAHLAMQQLGKGRFEIVYPSISIKAETPVAVVETETEKRGTTAVARAYLEGLYSKESQTLFAEHFFRPSDKEVLEKFGDRFPSVEMIGITELGGWQKAHEKHFVDGGIFDQIYGGK